jgi:hypothetical protein
MAMSSVKVFFHSLGEAEESHDKFVGVKPTFCFKAPNYSGLNS